MEFIYLLVIYEKKVFKSKWYQFQGNLSFYFYLKIKYLIKAFIALKEVTLIENVHQKLCHLSIKNSLPPQKKIVTILCVSVLVMIVNSKTLETGTIAQSVTKK